MPSQLFARKPLKLLLEEMKGENRLRRILGPVGLTSLGVGCIIGAGIFVIIGEGAAISGPALSVSFVVAGIACIFAALCYAEFASMVPVAGSAYTYAYATLGELFAWIIGWDLVLEYTVASAAVANSWSRYYSTFLKTFGWDVAPEFSKAPIVYNIPEGRFEQTGAYINLPALIIALLVASVLVKGIKESAWVNTLMVIVKVAIVLFVIAVGAFYVNPGFWSDFAPHGWTGLSFFGHTVAGQSMDGKPAGVIAAAAIVFFAFIGFDSVSTHAEEAKKPHRDVPIGIIASLLICTGLYIAVSVVITGMVDYAHLVPNANNISAFEAPVAYAFERHGLTWATIIISVGALAGMTSVLLVLMLSQPRVLLAMARDGLVPKSFFGAVHEKFRTPWKSTMLTGLVVALLASLLPLHILAELVNIGTLLAFVIVCAAVLIMRKTHPDAERPFRAPGGSASPILGIALCLMLMFGLPAQNWLRLLVWLAIGIAIYFFYGRHHSVMKRMMAGEDVYPKADDAPAVTAE
jgi:APA family basic amino acid/polyamine antiporter